MQNKSAISVNQRYKSATRIDGDIDFKSFIDDFVLHGTAINTIETLCRNYANSAQRTYTITGPYGSGKSTLALFLTTLLSLTQSERNYAMEKVAQVEGLEALLQQSFELKNGWKTIRHVCGLYSPAQSILLSIAKQSGQKTDEKLLPTLSDNDCLDQIISIFSNKTKKYDGYILLLDELGKALDFQSRSGSDLHFFQELAEKVSLLENNVLVIGFLHQTFAEYAKNKDAVTQKEWSKIQGRYTDFGFNPTIDESLILVGDSIQKSTELAESLQSKYSELAEITTHSFKDQSQNKSVLIKTLPLDPLVSLLLGPISRRRFSQNERSLFGFLASNEKFGFREFLLDNYQEKIAELNLYQPETLWDYLYQNLHHVIVTSSDGKAWLEACDAIQRASQKGVELHISITKVISLLTVFGFQNNLKASRSFLVEYITEKGHRKSEVESAISDLENWTVVIFRQHHNALFVFQGSDIDINSLVLETIESIKSGVVWTEAYSIHPPVLATSHYHKTGTMRWANTLLTEKLSTFDPSAIESTQLSGQAFATFVVVAKQSPINEIKALSRNAPSIIFAVPHEIEHLKAVSIELLALEDIKKNKREFNHDLIAKNELESRLEEAKRRLEEYFHDLLEKCEWVYKGKTLPRQPISAIASHVADKVFCDAPIVLNELVNRSKPSGSANAAINKLMMHMLEYSGKEDLGFEKDSFPPEKGIYLSCIKSKGWHQHTSEGFMFPPSWDAKSKELHPRMFKLWQSGFDLIKNSKSHITMDQLYKYWMSPPFGLTSGLCRIYGLALLKSLDGQVAYYDYDSTNSFIFIPELDEVFVNKLHKHPHETGVRYFEISGIQSELINRIAKATSTSKNEDQSILEIAKHIVKIVHLLPSWVKKTSGDSFIDGSNLGLSREAKNFRNEVLRANDPYKLVLESLSSIFSIDVSSKDGKEALARKLRSAIDDLSSQHEMLINGFKHILCSQLAGDFDHTLQTRCEKVAQSAQRPNVKEFATRLAKYINGKVNFEMVIATAAGVNERNWTDLHIRNALDEIQNLCIQFRRIESFSRLDIKNNSKPIALITKNEDGDQKEYEIHLSHSLIDDKEVKGVVSQLEGVLSKMSMEKKRAALSELLINNMDEVRSSDNAN